MLKLRSFDKWYLTEDMSYWTSFAVIQRWFLSFLHPVGYTDVLLCAFSYNVKARWINSYFSHSANLPTGLYILPSVISFFFIFNDFSETNYLKIRWTDFHNLFTEWKRFGCRWSIWTSFLIPQGTLRWQPIKVEKSAFFGPIYFLALPFGNGLPYRNSDFKRLDRMNFSTLCTILVTFGSETPEFTLLTIAPFAVIRQKSAYHAKYLRMS